MSMAKMYAFISAFPGPAQCWPGFEDPQNLSNTVWAPGKLDYHDDAMVDVLCKMSLSKLDALNYQNLIVIYDFNFKTGRIQKPANSLVQEPVLFGWFGGKNGDFGRIRLSEDTNNVGQVLRILKTRPTLCGP
jgi:hypothetical protein